MRKSFFSSSTIMIAISFAGLMMMPTSFGVTNVFGQPQQQQQEQPPGASADDNQRPNDYGPGHRFPVPFDQPRFAQAGNFSFGPIASIQNNESGQPAWIVVGTWRGNLLSFNETAATSTAAGSANGTTQNGTNGNRSNVAVFNANFRMIMLNGSAPHSHVITNFILSNMSSNENGTETYSGNSTVSMREGPLLDVPTIIKVSGEVISIFPEPSAVNQHFGNTPIYGAVIPEESQRRGHDHALPPSP